MVVRDWQPRSTQRRTLVVRDDEDALTQAIVELATRKILAWRLSNTLTADFCVDALEEALGRHGSPEIFNTDQGSHFTSLAFTSVLRDRDIQISMDGKGCWRDNIFVEHLWKTIKYE